jgi:hypothetical protein
MHILRHLPVPALVFFIVRLKIDKALAICAQIRRRKWHTGDCNGIIGCGTSIGGGCAIQSSEKSSDVGAVDDGDSQGDAREEDLPLREGDDRQ